MKIETCLVFLSFFFLTSFINFDDNISDKSLIQNKEIKISFDDFYLIIDNLEIWDEEDIFKSIQKDTAKVFLDIGESIENKEIKILKHKKGKIQVYQRFENSVTIMNEGPHCDLTNWKHFISDWKEINVINEKFTTLGYSEKDREKFINIDINELKKEVENKCGINWAKLIKNINSPTEYPSEVNTSRVFLKIEFTDDLDNQKSEKIISFLIPMGC